MKDMHKKSENALKKPEHRSIGGKNRRAIRTTVHLPKQRFLILGKHIIQSKTRTERFESGATMHRPTHRKLSTKIFTVYLEDNEIILRPLGKSFCRSAWQGKDRIK
jgi:hypothetical protein